MDMRLNLRLAPDPIVDFFRDKPGTRVFRVAFVAGGGGGDVGGAI